MSVTFQIVKKIPGQPGFQFITPDNFDPTPVVDPEFPEYGPIYPENPYHLNVHTDNATTILAMFGITGKLDCGGFLFDLDEVIQVCEQVLATIRSMPEMDEGTATSTTNDPSGLTWIKCGHIPGWYAHRFGKLLELAIIAKKKDAVICYA